MDADLSIYEWAFVNAGGRLAVRAAVAALLESHQLRSSDGFRIFAMTSTPNLTDPIETEIMAAASARIGREALIDEVSQDLAVRSIGSRLAADGYVRREQRRLGTIAIHVVLAMLLVAVALIGSWGAALTAFLVVCGTGALLSSAPLWRRSSVATRVGARALRERQASSLAQRGTIPLPAAETVALFGARALWACHPVVAAGLGVAHQRRSSLDEALKIGTIGHISHGFGHGRAPAPPGGLGRDGLGWATGGNDNGSFGGFGGFGGHGGGGGHGGH